MPGCRNVKVSGKIARDERRSSDSGGYTSYPPERSNRENPTTMARLAHHVFFTLKDRSDEAAEQLVAACQKYLDNHDGLVDFSVGTRDRELNRTVNGDFDVSLHVIFKDRPAHDAYQTAERHLQFIEEQKDNWATVQVMDSHLRD